MAALTVGGSPRLAARLTDYWVTVLRRTWRGSVITSFLLPFLYLAAMGVGLGGFVDKHTGSAALGGTTYLAFIAPGLLATTAMQTGVFESTYPVMGGFKWHRSYFAMAATPLTTADIVLAQLVFTGFRIVVTCGVFLGVMAVFGALHSWWGGLLAVAVAGLLGMAYAAPVTGLSARMKNESGFSLIFRLGLLPMFLFSGAFFPISQLPTAVAWVAYVTPIWHGVDLSRMLTLGQVEWWAAAGHLAYILVWIGAGWLYAVSGFHRRLVK
jgi:lipooligosaccharide transport system permease protein